MNTTIKPRLLIVEDDNIVLDKLERVFRDPLEKYRDHYGGSLAFDVDTATSGEEAKRLLRRAIDMARPYEVVLLDLGLPERSGDSEKLEVGIELLEKFAGSPNLAVVVRTVHSENPVIIKTLRSGAADFVPKDEGTESVFRSVVQAYKKVVNANWQSYKQESRQRWVLAQACAQVADRITGIVSEGLSEVLACATLLEQRIDERYLLNLESDSDDPICRALVKLQEAIKATARQCSEAREKNQTELEEIEDVSLSDLSSTVVDRLRAGLASRRLRLECSDAEDLRVRSIRSDLQVLLEEILFHAIEGSPEGGTIGIHVGESDDHRSVVIRVCDQGESIDELDCKENSTSVYRSIDERRWRLSLADRVAFNLGARIEADCHDSRNVVTLVIPELRHGTTSDRR